MNNFRVLCWLSTCTWLLTVESVGTLANLGFPEAWDGDKFHNFSCPSTSVPKWLEGNFMLQICGSYGDQNAPLGSKITHMFDAIGAVASLEIKHGEVKFSAEYYPAKPNRIWNFYGRNMSRSQLAWHPVRSPYNETAVESWDPMMKNDDSFPIHPNFNFWLHGNRVIATTEMLQLGMQFNVSSLSNFSAVNLRDTSNTNPTFTVLSVGAQERMASNGSVYTAASAYDPNSNKMFHVIYSIHPNGDRTMEAFHEYSAYDPSSCNQDGSYTGDKKNLAGYIHSIASTKSYIILPIGSNVINPCKLQPLNKNNQTQINGQIKQDNPAMEFVADHPVRFLIFDKSNKRFITETPIEVGISSVFITNQINAYEDDSGVIVADMIGIGNVNPYDLLTVENLINTSKNNLPMTVLFRFRINPRSNSNSDQQPKFARVNYEQPSYNRNFEENSYKFAYALTSPFTIGNSIVKIDITSQTVINEFKSPMSNSVVFREPWFVPKDKSLTNEDDGVLLFLGGDISTEKSSLYVLDAKNFSMLGCATLPTFVPFGFASRFFSADDLTCDSSCQTVRRQSNYNNAQQNSSPNQLGVQSNNQMYQNENTSNNSTFHNGQQNSSRNEFAVFNNNQMHQNGNAATNSSQLSDQSTATSNNFYDGMTTFSRVDNVTVYPPSNNHTAVTTDFATSTFRSTTSGNRLFNESNNTSSGFAGSQNYSTDIPSASSTEFFRTTTFAETRQSQPPVSDIIADTSSVTSSRTTLIRLDNANDNYPQPTFVNCITENRSSWTWIRFVHEARKLICSFYKQPIDKTGLDFCMLNSTLC